MAEKSWQTALMRAGEVGRIVLKRDPGHTIVGKVGVLRTKGEDTTFRVGGMSTITIDQDDWEFQVEMELLPTARGSVVYDTIQEVYYMRGGYGDWVPSHKDATLEYPGTFKTERVIVMFDAADHFKG